MKDEGGQAPATASIGDSDGESASAREFLDKPEVLLP